MPSGNPPIVSHGAESGTISIQAQPPDNPENRLIVKLTDNKRLELFVEPGDISPITIPLNRERWKMEIREID
jgi:hypothetical protein